MSKLNRLNRFGLLLAMLAMGLQLLVPLQAQAFPRWQDSRQITWAEIQANGWARQAVEDPSLLLADERWRNQDWNALTLDIPPDRYIGVPYTTNGKNTAVVYAVYDPQTATGSILMMRAWMTMERMIRVQAAAFTPSSWDRLDAGGELMEIEHQQLQGSPFGQGGHPNPFDDFKGHPDGKTFIHVQPAAFYAAVAAAVAYSRAEVGYVATLNARQTFKQKKSGNIVRKHVTTTERVYVSPVWMAVTPAGTATENAGTYSFCFPAAACPAAGISPPAGSRCVGEACVFDANMNFQPMGVGHDFPVDESLVFEHSETKSGFTFLAMIVFTALLSAAAFAAVAALAPSAGATGAAAGGGGGLSVGQAAGYGAAFGATANATYNYSNGVHSLMDPINRVFASGKADLNSLGGQAYRWDARPAIRAAVEAGPMDAPGATGQGMRDMQPNAQSVVQGGRGLHPADGRPTPATPYRGLPGQAVAPAGWTALTDPTTGRPYYAQADVEGGIYYVAPAIGTQPGYALHVAANGTQTLLQLPEWAGGSPAR